MKNYEKVCSTNKEKLQFFKQTPMKVKKKRIVKSESINYVENVEYVTKIKKKQAIAKVCKLEKWKSERDRELAEVQEFCKVAENYLHNIFNLSTVETKVKAKISES